MQEATEQNRVVYGWLRMLQLFQRLINRIGNRRGCGKDIQPVGPANGPPRSVGSNAEGAYYSFRTATVSNPAVSLFAPQPSVTVSHCACVS